MKYKLLHETYYPYNKKELTYFVKIWYFSAKMRLFFIKINATFY
ncbi:hypothetical protein HMPREF0973_02254 [Prevotella veroralis F0319]|uniref:Uncharacterized protein n=1 Tax=Prevotella veroralis F0319 TaxID=649761 RepID=C9MRJ7_9BACT|nr:hypothetical protein HMPREF0973_02254 [Prevotella veroralis F0319]